MRADQEGEVGKRLNLLLLMWLMWMRFVEVVGEVKGSWTERLVLGCSSAHTCRRRGALSLMNPLFARGHCNEGFSSKACSFFCKRLLSVGRLIYPRLMENSQLDSLLCTLNFLISGQWGGGVHGRWQKERG